MKKGKITMEVILGLMFMVLTAVIFIQFKTIGQTDINSLEVMREDELKAEITDLKLKNTEIEKKIEETNKTKAEYEKKIASGKEASELFKKELKESSDLVGKNEVKGERNNTYH